jgi:hypothetical protein
VHQVQGAGARPRADRAPTPPRPDGDRRRRRRSGPRTGHRLMPLEGEYALVASKGGAPEHPSGTTTSRPTPKRSPCRTAPNRSR